MSELGYTATTVLTLPGDIRKPAAKDIISQAALDHGLSAKDLIGPDRHRRVAWARFDAMTRLRAVQWSNGGTRYSFPQIGRMLGGRDHTTVIHGVRRWAEISAEQAETA